MFSIKRTDKVMGRTHSEITYTGKMNGAK